LPAIAEILDVPMNKQEKYAIAIQDGDQLFLFLNITRGEQGDVYVNFNERHPNHKPHSSYHASGQRHHKGNYRILLPRRMFQKPDEKFENSENIITTSIRRGDGRAWGIICRPEVYQDLMIINDSTIFGEFGLQLSIDLFESGTLPSGYVNCGIDIIQQGMFRNEIPKIAVTLYKVVALS